MLCCFGKRSLSPAPAEKLETRTTQKTTASQEEGQVVAQRVFPFQSSSFNPWRADKFLNATLGEGKWSLDQENDRFILHSERDLTEAEQKELLKIAGRHY